MFDLTVRLDHSFFVVGGYSSALVHNTNLCDLFHGTDIDSATGIAEHGIDESAARELGGGGEFWVTNKAADAELFAQVNPAGKDPAVVGITLHGQSVADAVAHGVLKPVLGLPGAYTVTDWDALNAIARFSVIGR